MADGSGKVAKLVQQKLEDYFNKHRVEKEFDSSGKGIHTTTPMVVQLELSYLQAAEEQWKRKTKEKKKNAKKEAGSDKGAESRSKDRGDESRSKNRPAEKGRGHLKDGEGDRGGGNAKKEDRVKEEEEVRSKDGADKQEQGRRSRDGEGSREGARRGEDEVSPKVTKNSKIKSRVKASEIDRITRNAQTAMSQVSLSRIHRVHRYRPNLIPNEYIDLGKVAHVSNHVNAILNTEHAWECAEENDDREAARKYVEEKNEAEVQLKKREKARKEKSQNAPAPAENTDKPKRSPLWLRMEIERAKQAKAERKDRGRENNPKAEDGTEKGRRNQDQDASGDHRGETAEAEGVKGAELDGQKEREEDGKDEGSEHDRAKDGRSTKEEVMGIKDEGAEHDRSRDGRSTKEEVRGKDEGAEHDRSRGRSSKEEMMGKDEEGDEIVDNESDGCDGDSLKDDQSISQGTQGDLDSKHEQVSDDCLTGKHDFLKSEGHADEKTNSPISHEGGTRGGDVKEVIEHGEKVERKDEVELGDETGSVSECHDEGKQVVDEEVEEAASRPGGSQADEGTVRTEEYIRAESMVSLTEISNHGDDRSPKSAEIN